MSRLKEGIKGSIGPFYSKHPHIVTTHFPLTPKDSQKALPALLLPMASKTFQTHLPALCYCDL